MRMDFKKMTRGILEIAFKRADQALYDVNNQGENGWKIV